MTASAATSPATQHSVPEHTGGDEVRAQSIALGTRLAATVDEALALALGDVDAAAAWLATGPFHPRTAEGIELLRTVVAGMEYLCLTRTQEPGLISRLNVLRRVLRLVEVSDG